MRTSILLTIMCLLLTISGASAEAMTDLEIGVRGGVDGCDPRESYTAAEIYFLKQLPWSTIIGDKTPLTSRFDIGATYLKAGGDESGMVSIGAELVLHFWEGNLELEAGFRPTWMFDHEYGEDDFGGGMQFTSHAGLTLNWQPVVFNYRFQHTSNASIYDENPGLNLHMIGLGYRF